MDNRGTDTSLGRLWQEYISTGEQSHFKNYTGRFLKHYRDCIDINFAHLDRGRYGYVAEGPHHTDLPQNFLQVLASQLSQCAAQLTSQVQTELVLQAQDIVCCFIVIVRNLDNVWTVAACDFMQCLIHIAGQVTLKLSNEGVEDSDVLSAFVKNTLYFFECLYDPYFVWRKELRGWSIEKDRMRYKPAPLHVEVIPFFYESMMPEGPECFQHPILDTELQRTLFHVFGAIITGSQDNALKAICPATLDVLLRVLWSHALPGPMNSLRDEEMMEVKQLILKCLVRLVHVLHNSSPEQRQVEVGNVIEGYFQAILRAEQDEQNTQLQMDMLSSIDQMLETERRKELQTVFVAEGIFDTFVGFFHKITLTGTKAQGLAMAILRVMKSVMTGSNVAKDKFKEKIGYSRFVEALKSLGQPSKDLLKTVLGLVVEDVYEPMQFYVIRNTQAALMLIQWLPDIQSHDLQLWLSECLKQVCCQGNHNRMQCCNDSILHAILDVLRREKQIDSKAVGNLIGIVECLGTLSITSIELKQLVRLLKPEDGEEHRRYYGQLIHAMSAMARKSDRESALHYFDFQTEEAGITVGNLGKWPGAGFGFYGWLCLDNDATLLTRGADFVRRQLYSVTTDSGSGFEAFFTVEGVLVIAVCIKKEFMTLALTDCPITDCQWHSVAISHVYGKRLFGQSEVTVYVDGKEKKKAFLKFPLLGEPFTHCTVGSPGVGTTHNQDHSTVKPESKRSGFTGFLQYTLTPALTRQAQNAATSPVVTVQSGNQDTEFGIPVSLFGQIGSVFLFNEALTDTQVHNFHNLGPNHLGVFQLDDGSLTELASKRLFHYNAKASSRSHCLDLSNNGRVATVKGHKCTTWDIKDVINSIGGIQVIFPLFELVTQHIPEQFPVPPSPEINKENIQREDSTEWVLVQNHSHADSKLERNQVAGFLILLRNLVTTNPINQEALVREGAVATLGLLLQKCEPELLDEHVLMAIQLLVESVAAVNVTLLHHIYQYLLFDFRLWSRSHFEVRKGHIQYLSTIIKDDKRYFRKKYGVQYILDIIRTYYRTREASGLSLDDNQTIRAALFGLIKFYAGKEITFEELDQILNFIVAVREEFAISELLELLLSFLEVHGKNDQVYRLMFEPAMGELLYMLLTQEEYSVVLKEKVLKTLALLLKYDKIQEKNKVQLRLVERGMFPGVLNLMNTSQISLSVIQLILDQVLLTESSASANAALSVVHLISNCDITIKLEASRKLLAALFAKPSSPKLYAQQLGWQEIVVRLLILQPHTANNPQRMQSTDISNPQPTSNPAQLFNGTATQTADPETSSSLSLSSQVSQDYSAATNKNNNVPHRPSNIALNSKPSVASTTTLFDDMPTPAATPLFAKKKLFDEDSQTEGVTESNSSGNVGVPAATNPGDITPLASPVDGPVNFGLYRSSSEMGELGDAGLNSKGLEDSELASALMRMGLRLDGADQLEKQEELCQNILIILFTLVWKGVEGCDNDAWKQRGQVFAAMNYTVESYQLLKPKIQLNRRLLELMLQGCIMDLKETGQTNKSHMKNCVYLVRWLYNFLMLEDGPPEEKYNERIIEDLMTIYDLLTIWDVDSSWTEMEQLGLRILLAHASQPDITLCSIAAAKLHTILQTRPVEKLQESCYVMAEIDAILCRAVTDAENEDQYNFLMPVMKALVDKTRSLLDMDAFLPQLPTTFMSPTFYDDFKLYSQSTEWRNFMDKMVTPSKQQYVAVIFDDIRASLKTYIGECHEDVMVDGHKRAKERGESKLKFQEQIGESFKHKARQENKRYQNIVSQLRNQQASAMRQWRNTRMFFTGERGAWADSTTPELHWKLSNVENYSRMRPKLVPNYAFDMHTEASRLRDNIETPVSSQEELLPLTLSKEVKVADFENIGDDRLGDEEWNIISESDSTATEELSGKEKLVLSEDCELITVMESIKGRVEVTTTHVYFWDTMHSKEPGASEDFKWALSQLREIHFRRYNLRRSALEFFLTDQTNYFLNFQRKVRNKVYSRILSMRPPNLIYYGSRSPAELLKTSGLTQKWVNREITNFEYLMQLNTIAGRTYNDLSQYPVFPWILCDYTSDVLDLDDPKVYRDLSKPIGVVNPKNENEVREKYESFEDPTGSIEKFHYGTHYSNAAGVMHYLLRLEPFTTLHVDLQSGRFDIGDRQFHSLATTWNMLMDSPNDVKELIPEFFYLPDFLENSNNFDLGHLQNSTQTVNDVVLPKWAKSPEDFITKHMRALESEHVSLHLHQWVDLIFGYKQKGPAAVNALNVFYYCTYEGAVDVEAITDPVEQKALEGIISNFGQTPCQLLKEAHPRRMSFDEVSARSSKSDKPLSVLLFLNQLKAYFVEATVDSDPLVFICVPRNQARSILQHGLPDTMLAVMETGTIAMHGWLPYDKSISNYFTFDKDASLGTTKTRRKLKSFSPGVRLSPNVFTVTHDAKLLISGGHWDNSLRVYSTAKNKTTQIVIGHTDLVSCVAIDHSGSTVISGSLDTTCMIWSVVSQGGSAVSLHNRPSQILYGHDSEITAVQISVALDVAASGSKDGTVIIHTVRKGIYMRTLRPTLEKGMRLSVEHLAMSDVGQICVYCSQVQGKAVKQDLHLYSVNGKHLAQETVQQPVSHMIVTSGYLLLGNSHGNLVFKDLLGLRTQATMPLHIPITCLSATSGNSHILVGLQDGKLIIVGIRRPSEVK